MTGLLSATKDANRDASLWDEDKLSLNYKLVEARRNMKAEAPYNVEVFDSTEIDAMLQNGALPAYTMDRASVAPIPDEDNQLTEPDSSQTTMPATPTIEMRKMKIDPFRLEGLADSLAEFQRTQQAAVTLNQIRSIYKPMLYDRHFADNNVFNDEMLKQYRLANPLYPGNPIDFYGHMIFSDPDETDPWQHRIQSSRDFTNLFGAEVDNNPGRSGINGGGADKMVDSLAKGGPGGIKPYDSTNRTLHMIYPSVTRAGPWQYAGGSFDAGMAKAKQRLRLEKG